MLRREQCQFGIRVIVVPDIRNIQCVIIQLGQVEKATQIEICRNVCWKWCQGIRNSQIMCNYFPHVLKCNWLAKVPHQLTVKHPGKPTKYIYMRVYLLNV